VLVDDGPQALTRGRLVLPVQDLHRFLLGDWHISRRVSDRRTGAVIRLAGLASFTPAFGGLTYHEEGLLVGSTFRAPASQTYRFDIRGSRAEVRFQDGRFFHEIELTQGCAHVRHVCGADLYTGRYVSRGPNLFWTTTWQVSGPRKRMLIVTRYSGGSPFSAPLSHKRRA
jgi:hypothetical protein